MKYTMVRIEEKNGKYVLRVDMDGNIREISFNVKEDAMALMNRLKLYGLLAHGDAMWMNEEAA